jgi:hypothetical protein
MRGGGEALEKLTKDKRIGVQLGIISVVLWVANNPNNLGFSLVVAGNKPREKPPTGLQATTGLFAGPGLLVRHPQLPHMLLADFSE